MSILQLLAAKNYITVNKILIKEIGLEETILLGELASEYDYWEIQEKLEDGYFFSTVETIEENTALSKYQQRKALEKLEELGIIEQRLMGMPAKRYIKINEDAVVKKLNNKWLKNLTTSGKKTEHLINKNIINNNKENNNNKLLLSKKVFKKPTLEEVEEYCKSRNNNIDAQQFIDFYESKGWLIGKSKMKDWKASVRTWERNSFTKKKKENESEMLIEAERLVREREKNEIERNKGIV